MHKHIKHLLTIILLIFSINGFSQLSTQGGVGAQQLVENVLLGGGVTVSNIQFTGANGAIGSFEASNSSLGMDEGLILTTGTINSGPAGPYGPNNREDAGLDNGAGGYAPLTNIVGTNTFNASVLEFDFVPQSDTVRFEYIFGSEEYPEYVGSQFNDVFAFFISGPGIQGQQNMAIIPGTNQPVAINNVNNGFNNNGNCTNCQYYVNNGTGNNAPYNQDNFYIQYDGFTTTLEAFSPVQCGETYHLTIAIADVGDAFWDSGIFLAANSLSSEQPVSVDYELTSNPFNDGQTMAQGCSGAEVTVTRSGAGLDQELTVPISLGGSAVEGVDYSNIPNEITFPANETEVTFSLEALAGGTFTGTVNIIIEFEIEDPCGNDNTQVIELFINETADVEVDVTSGEIACPGESVEIFANASGGGGGYEYQWSTGETTPSISFTPQATQTITVEVTDECLEQTAVGEIEVEVPVFDSLELDVTDDIIEQCPFVPYDLTVDATGGAGVYNYQWTNENGSVVSQQDLMTVIVGETSTFYINVEDKCGDSASDSVSITILSPPLVVTITPEQEICPGDSVELVANATGGFGDYYFVWPHDGNETSNSIVVSPDSTTDYRVIVRDDCQTFQVREETRVVVLSPDAQFQVVTDPIFEGLPITFQNLSNNGVSYEWFFGDGNTSTQVHPNHTYDFANNFEVTLIATDINGCTDTITKPLPVRIENYIYVPNAFTPTGDVNPVFKAETINISSLKILIFNRWGEVVYESNNVNFQWDGTYNGNPVRPGVYPWLIEYETIEGDEFSLEGFVTLIK